MDEFDAEGKNIEGLKKASFDDYDIEEIDKQSLKEIKRMLIENKYHDEEIIRDHLDYLDKLSNKLVMKQRNEANIGYQNFEVSSMLKQIDNLRQHLIALLDNT